MTSVAQRPFNRDAMARHYADRHWSIDSGLKGIYYLPTDAPEREVRLLEVNDLVAAITPLEPFDFGVEPNGPHAHTLNVLDVTPEQWEAVERGELTLPSGWSLANIMPLTKR